jgi:hypothetical protein
LRDFALQSRLSTKNGTILLVSSDGELTPELEKEILRLDFPLPTKEEIKGWVDDILERLKATSAIKVDEERRGIEQDEKGIPALGALLFPLPFQLSLESLYRGHDIGVLSRLHETFGSLVGPAQERANPLHVDSPGAGPEDDVALLLDRHALDAVDHAVLFERMDGDQRV